MPIQIIDNFELGAAKPIDNRFVVGPGQFYTDKDDISYKYTGLRVWDLTGGSPGVGYVWDGSAWQTEASSSIAGGGTANQVPKFISPGNVVTDSIITDNGSRVGISWTNLGTSPYTLHKLVVNGSIMSITGGFYGSGANITNINASNISSGFLSLARLSNTPTGRILISGSSQPEWTDKVTINTAPSNSSTFGEQGSVYFKNFSTTRIYSYHNPGDLSELFIDVGGSIMKVSAAYFDFNKQVRFVDGTAASPSISFSLDTNTGIYRVGGEQIGFSTNGSNRLTISTSNVTSTLPILIPSGSVSAPGIAFSANTGTGIWYSQSGTGILAERNLRFSLNTTEVLRFNSSLFNGLNATLEASSLRLQDGLVATPALSFESDTNTGIYKSGSDKIAISTGSTKRVEIGTGLSINSTSDVNKIWVGAISLTYNMGGAGVTSINDYSALPPGWSYTSGNFSSGFYGTGGGFIQLTAPSNWSNTDLVSVSANMRYAGLAGGGGSQDNFGFTITPSINSDGITFYFRRVTAGAANNVGQIGFMFTAVERN